MTYLFKIYRTRFGKTKINVTLHKIDWSSLVLGAVKRNI